MDTRTPITLPSPDELFRSACRIHCDHAMHRYLLSMSEGRYSGGEKATFHQELCEFYVAVFVGCAEPDRVRRHYEIEFQAVRCATQGGLTDHLDETIGFPLRGRPDYPVMVERFFERFHDLALQALKASVVS